MVISSAFLTDEVTRVTRSAWCSFTQAAGEVVVINAQADMVPGDATEFCGVEVRVGGSSQMAQTAWADGWLLTRTREKGREGMLPLSSLRQPIRLAPPS
jgi:hypothetical protein